MTTTSQSTITLLSATPSGTAARTSIDLAFNTSMARGTGKIYVTDGAVQTVIDRVTGLPVMRIVGASVTREIAASGVTIDGTHVKLDVTGLQGGHQYSVVMDPGVLVSSANQPFAGLRSPGQVAFTAPAGLGVAKIELDGPTLSASHNLDVTITFSQAVANLDPAALSTPGAHLLGAPRKVGDGTVWHVTLAGADATNADSNAVGVNLNLVRDLAGNPGSGTYTSTAHYAVDTVKPAGPAIELDAATLNGTNTIGVTLRFAEAVTLDSAAFTTPHATASDLHSTDGGRTWLATLRASDTAASSGNLVSLDMSKVTDLAGNRGDGIAASSASYAVRVDSGIPIVLSVELGTQYINDKDGGIAIIKFSEAVTFDKAAISVPDASVSKLETVDNITWIATLKGAPDTTSTGNVLTVDMSKVHDLAGNAGSGTAASSQSYAVDSRPPVLAAAMTLDGTTVSEGEPVTVTLTFSEAVVLDPATAISAPHAAIGQFGPVDDSLKVWQLTLVPSEVIHSPANVLELDMGKVFDLAGNAGSGKASSPSYAVETAISAALVQRIDINDLGADRFDHVTADAERYLGGSFTGLLADGQHIRLAIDGVAVDSDKIDTEVSGETGVNSWYYEDSGTFADGVHSIEAWIEDDKGNTGPRVSQAITIDTSKPTLASAAGQSPFDVTRPLVITFSEPVYWGSDGADHQVIRLINRSDDSVREIYVDDRNLSADRTTLTISADDLHLLGAKDYRVTLPTGIIDLAGNELDENEIEFHTQGSDYADLTGPRALRAEATVDSSWSGASFGAGTMITIRVRFNEPVKFADGANPALGLDNGASAGSATISEDKLEVSFRYTVAGTDADTPHLAVTDTSALVGQIADLAGNLLTAADIAFLGFEGPDRPISIDTHGPASLAGARLADFSDTGVSDSDGITSNNTPTLTGSGAEANAHDIRIYEGASAIGHGYSNDDGTWFATVNLGARLTDGTHTLVVKQVDQAGNESVASPAVTVTIDTAPPPPLAAPLTASGVTNDSTPTFTGSGAAANSIIKLYASVNGQESEYGHTESRADGTWSLTADDLDDGSYSFNVKQFDLAGNASVASPGVALTVDTSPPAAPPAPVLDANSDKGVPGDGITNINKPTFTGTGALPNSVVKLYANEREVGTIVSDAQGNWRITASVLSDGTYSIGVKQFDNAGNQSDYSKLTSVTIDTVAPQIVRSDVEHLGTSVELTFSEDILLVAPRTFSLADANGHVVRTFNGGDLTWHITHSGTVLELDGLELLSLAGKLHLVNASGSVQDTAGNVALVGAPAPFEFLLL